MQYSQNLQSYSNPTKMQNDKIKGVTQPRKQPFYKNTDRMTDACAYTDRLGFLVRRKQLKQQPLIIAKLNNIIPKDYP